MKALTFLEWCIQNTSKAYGSLAHYELYCEVLNFYNQKFSVDMLVNPVILETNGYEVNAKNVEEWQQAESLRLFDGWEENGELSYLHIINNRHTIIADFLESAITFRENDNYECNEYYFYCGYNNITLNDFITLCNLAGIELHWNPNNPTVKELGL